jgi:hypothetical protein
MNLFSQIARQHKRARVAAAAVAPVTVAGVALIRCGWVAPKLPMECGAHCGCFWCLGFERKPMSEINRSGQGGAFADAG